MTDNPLVFAIDFDGTLCENKYPDIGKLNYHPSNIDWADFGRRAEAICKMRGFNYYIKDSLRREMEK